MKILIKYEQLEKIKDILIELTYRNDVKEFDIMYNPLMKSIFIVRFKSFYTTEEGAIGTEIKYLCIDPKGVASDCEKIYGDNLYIMLKDYSVIYLNNPLITVI